MANAKNATTAATIKILKWEDIAVPCLICGDAITGYDSDYRTPGICPKCKAAVMAMRERMEADNG